jgi:hypothetical protein
VLTAILLIVAVSLVSVSLVSVSLRSRVSIVPPPAEAGPPAADRTLHLVSQFTAGVRGSRAPPAASA